MSNWFTQLKKFLGGSERREARGEAPSPSQRSAPSPTETNKKGKPTQPRAGSKPAPAAQTSNTGKNGRPLSYLLVVGLDFGTAFTKCVVRDAHVRDPGRAHPVRFKLAGSSSYLVPSVVYMDGDKRYSAFDVDENATLRRIDHLKMRLVSCADPARAHAWGMDQIEETKVSSAWFIAQVLAHVGREIREIWPDFGDRPDDTCFVNICVPIAYAEGQGIETTILDSLCAAWNTVGPAGVTPPSVAEVSLALRASDALIEARNFCYAYPETSANLQTYLRSRARLPGLYLLMDVGAGTMDLSFFILHSDTGTDKPLIYLHGSVLDVGSSRLEIEVLKRNPSFRTADVVAHKEGRVKRSDPLITKELDWARRHLRNEVAVGVGKGVSDAEARLSEDLRVSQRQMKEVNLLFAGGGFCRDPYEEGARFFHRNRQWSHEPLARELPEAVDIKWPKSSDAVRVSFKRLSVAYGLSFPRFELENHKFPNEVTPAPGTIKEEGPERLIAPSKDDV